VLLDGHQQFYVTEVNLSAGTLVRGYNGEPKNEHQTKLANGLVFDREKEDFVLETLRGDIFIKRTDKEKARQWLARHSH
jgi:hypothetical protein